MVAKAPNKELERLPQRVTDFIKLVIRKMRYRQTVRAEVTAELTAHFEDELKDCKSDEERQQKAEKLIAEFGDVKLLGILLRRAKKRCRPLWRTMVARTFQAIGILILFFVVYVAWFLTGRPVISVDYLAQLNQMVRPAADESLNAAPLYIKATELYGKVSDDFLLFFAENYKEIGDPEVGGRFRRGGRLRAEELADDIRRLLSTKSHDNFAEKTRLQIESEVGVTASVLLGKGYHETSLIQRKFIKAWMQDQKEALDLVGAGAQKPYYWQKYGAAQNTYLITGIRLPRLSKYRGLARVLCWRAWLSAEQGRYEDAFGDIKTCYRIGQHIKGDNTLVIEQIVGIAVEALAAQTLRDILSEHEIDTIELTNLQKAFEQILANEDFTISFQAERLSIYDAIQRCFTEDSFGGGHLSLRGFRQLMSSVHSFGGGHLSLRGFRQLMSFLRGDDSYSILEHIIDEGAWSTPLHVLFTHPNKQETREMAERYYGFWNKMAHKTPAWTCSEGIDLERQSNEIIKGNILLEILAANFDRAIERSYELRTEAKALVSIIALLRHKNDKAYYPENLQELVTTAYLGELPMDPWSDKPLVYSKTDEGFILYSVGRNFEDDGGELVRDYDGRVGMWVGEGDAVFWPAPKPETPEERNERVEKEWDKTRTIRFFGPCPHSEHRRKENKD